MISEYLKVGKENAVKSSELMEKTGLSQREVQALVESERDEGAFICASVNGYYLARDHEELHDFFLRYTAAARKMLRTMRHIRRELEETEGQTDLDFENLVVLIPKNLDK